MLGTGESPPQIELGGASFGVRAPTPTRSSGGCGFATREVATRFPWTTPGPSELHVSQAERGLRLPSRGVGDASGTASAGPRAPAASAISVDREWAPPRAGRPRTYRGGVPVPRRSASRYRPSIRAASAMSRGTNVIAQGAGGRHQGRQRIPGAGRDRPAVLQLRRRLERSGPVASRRPPAPGRTRRATPCSWTLSPATFTRTPSLRPIDNGNSDIYLGHDIDGDARRQGLWVDIGADEAVVGRPAARHQPARDEDPEEAGAAHDRQTAQVQVRHDRAGGRDLHAAASTASRTSRLQVAEADQGGPRPAHVPGLLGRRGRQRRPEPRGLLVEGQAEARRTAEPQVPVAAVFGHCDSPPTLLQTSASDALRHAPRRHGRPLGRRSACPPGLLLVLAIYLGVRPAAA